MVAEIIEVVYKNKITILRRSKSTHLLLRILQVIDVAFDVGVKLSIMVNCTVFLKNVLMEIKLLVNENYEKNYGEIS